jgi:hypothetical protein
MDFLTYICALPYPKRRGRIPELITDNPVAIDAFAKRWDRPGYGVYECVSLLRPGSRRRSLENVGYSWLIHLDIDLRTLKETYEEVLRKLKQLPSWIEIRDSGGGGFHLIIKLKEWAEAGSKEFERANTARTRLTHILRADKAPDHAAALLRKLGTRNFKYGKPQLCRIVQAGGPVDITEIEEFLDTCGGEPLFTPIERATNGHDRTEGPPQASEGRQPVDVEARLAAMEYQGARDSGVHLTQLHCTASLLRSGIPVEDVVAQVLKATKKAVAGNPRAHDWNWLQETLAIERMCYDFVSKNPELFSLLPDTLAAAWSDRLAEGRTGLCVVYSRHIGWHIRSRADAKEEPPTGGSPKDEKAKPNCRFKLVPFADLHLGSDPLYLVDELIPIRGLVDVWGKAKCCKSFWTFDLCFHIAMGWEYRDRYVQQGAVILPSRARMDTRNARKPCEDTTTLQRTRRCLFI